MKAAILAGGLGKRLGKHSRDIPKPMVRIGGKPILEHQIDCLKKYGVNEFFLLIGHLGDVIREYFADGSGFGVNIKYIHETKPLGTAGAVKQLSGLIDEDFLLIYGDVFFELKLDDFIDYHKKRDGIATIVVHPTDHPDDSDLVTVDGEYRVNKILSKNDKPECYQNIGNAAFYIISPRVLQFIPEGSKTDFMTNIFPEVLRAGESVYAYQTTEYIKDMGTPDRLARVTEDYESGKIGRLSRENKRKAIFLDRDGTINRDIHLLHEADKLELLPGVTEAIKKINESEYLAIVVTNQSVVARNLCDLLGLQDIHTKLETLLGRKGAYLDDIFFCPHHPDCGFPEENLDYKIKCNCRKPAVGMIDAATSKLNIDLDSSWIVGDSTIDIQTGINAGLKTILVRTGQGGRDGRYDASEDYVYDSLIDAVEAILQSETTNSKK